MRKSKKENFQICSFRVGCGFKEASNGLLGLFEMVRRRVFPGIKGKGELKILSRKFFPKRKIHKKASSIELGTFVEQRFQKFFWRFWKNGPKGEIFFREVSLVY